MSAAQPIIDPAMLKHESTDSGSPDRPAGGEKDNTAEEKQAAGDAKEFENETSAAKTKTEPEWHNVDGLVADSADLEGNKEDRTPSSSDTSSPRNVHGVSWVLVVAATLSSIFVYALDNTIVANIVPAIVNDLDEVEKLPWLSVGFMIGGVAMVMPVGKLYSLYNAKWLYIASCVLFLAASALCAAAPTMNAMIVGRVFAGAGGNGMYLGVVTLLSVTTSDRQRPTYLSLVGLIWGVGTVLGPVVGGGFELVTWRWAFWINLIIGGIWGPIYIFLLPPFDPLAGTPLSKRAEKFDYLGAVLSIAGFVCLIMAMSFGGAVYPWNSGPVIALFVVGISIWIVFFATQAVSLFTTERNRMFPVHFLKNKEALLVFLTMGVGACASFVPIYYIPVYFQFTRGDGALQSAVRMLPDIVCLSGFILLNGAFMSKFGYYKPWYLGGFVLGLVGTTLMSRATSDTPTAAIYGFEVLMGVGTGMYAQGGYAVIQTCIDPVDMSYGISFIMVAQLGGMAFSLSTAGAILLNEAQAAIAAAVPSITTTEVQQLILGTSNNFLESLPAAQHAAALEALVLSLRKVFIPCIASTVIGLIASVFMKNKKMFG